MSSSLPPTPPSNGPAYTNEVKAKFDKLFPKYGALWKSMVNARKSSAEKNNAQECHAIDNVFASNDEKKCDGEHDKENAIPNVVARGEESTQKESSTSNEASDEPSFSLSSPSNASSKSSAFKDEFSANNHSAEKNSIDSTFSPKIGDADKSNNRKEDEKNPIGSPISTPLSSSSSVYASTISPQFLSPLVLSILSTAKKTKQSHAKSHSQRTIHDDPKEEEENEDDEGGEESEYSRTVSISDGAKNLAEAFEDLSLGGDSNHENVVNENETNNIKDGEVSSLNEEDSNKHVWEQSSLLNAIFNRTTVSFRVPSKDHEELCGDECHCADPILELDGEADGGDDDHARDDQIDSDGNGLSKSSGSKVQAGGDDAQGNDAEYCVTHNEDRDGDVPNGRGIFSVGGDVEKSVSDMSNEAEIRQGENIFEDHDNVENDSCQDDDVVWANPRRNRNKAKAFVLDSDYEDEESDNDSRKDKSKDMSSNSPGESEDEYNSIQSEESDDEVEEVSRRSYNSEKENGNPISCDKSPRADESIDIEHESACSVDESSISASSEEEEWIELSSDEEDDAEALKERERRAKRAEAIIILSSDEEESESDYNDDEESNFSVSERSKSDKSYASMRGKTTKPNPITKPPSRKGKLSTRTPSPSNLTNCTIPRKTPKPPMSQLTDAKSKQSFRKHRESITEQTFRDFDTRAFKNALSSVTVIWSNKLNTTAGITRMKGRLGTEHVSSRVATIELATKVIDNEDRLRSTLLHEMCHAAMWLVDGVHKPPHGKCFKKWANISMRKVNGSFV